MDEVGVSCTRRRFEHFAHLPAARPLVFSDGLIRGHILRYAFQFWLGGSSENVDLHLLHTCHGHSSYEGKGPTSTLMQLYRRAPIKVSGKQNEGDVFSDKLLLASTLASPY